MKKVYKNLSDGGVKGIMFDYTSTGWADFGGMENTYATAANMYRNIFQLASEGLKTKHHWIHERNLERGSDLTLDLVTSQRVWGDTDGITPEMITRSGLRWYKNRLVTNYDMDSKNIHKLSALGQDNLRQVLTMSYVASGRLLLGNSFAKMDSNVLHDLSRVFPFPDSYIRARPIDAFVNSRPELYDIKIDDNWHQLTIYNQDNNMSKGFSISLSQPNIKAGLELDPNFDYYFYDFWNDKLIGILNGKDRLSQNLRKSEARMISIHKKESHPQVISTNRHLMQGYYDLENISWDKETLVLSGAAKVVKNDPFVITIANNGYKIVKVNVSKDHVNYIEDGDIIKLTIEHASTENIKWRITYNLK